MEVNAAAGFDEMIDDSPKDFSEVTMQELDNKIRQLKDYKDELLRIEMMADPIKERKANLEKWLIACFKQHKRSSFKSAYGTLVVTNTLTVKVPQGKQRDEFREYLEGKGSFDTLWTVNSKKLNSWYREEMSANEKDPEFNIPGLSDPVDRTTVALRKR